MFDFLLLWLYMGRFYIWFIIEVIWLCYVIKMLLVGEVIFSYFSIWSVSDIILCGVEDWIKSYRNIY